MNRASHWTGVALAAALTGSLARAQTTERASVDSGGAQGNNDSGLPSISADGRFVAFWSYASNLVAGDTNGFDDVFVRDRQSGTTERVSVDSGGAQGNDVSHYSSISADGRFVAFQSRASNLVAGDTNGFVDVFVRDRQSGTTERVSLATGGAQGNSDIEDDPLSISADGRFVAFTSVASNLVPGDTNLASDVFVHDRQSGTTERASVDSGGAQGNGDSDNQSISADGRFVAFESHASNLVAGDTNGFRDAFVHDRQSGTTERVSVDSGGAQGNDGSDSPSLSADGRFVAVESDATNRVAGDPNAADDVFVLDRLSGTTERVSVDSGGAQGNDSSERASISDDGRFVAFPSEASNLVAGDTNESSDVFVREHGQPPVAFCFGDGSGTACPCGNAGITGHGCGSSLNPNGAILSGSGNTSLSGDTLVLSGGGMPNAFALYLQGTSQQSGGLGIVFGDGLRCAGGTIIRLGTKLNVAGSSQYPSGTDAPVSVRGMVTSAGTRTYQVWYRNAAAFCTVSTFNLSNGLEVQWNP